MIKINYVKSSFDEKIIWSNYGCFSNIKISSLLIPVRNSNPPALAGGCLVIKIHKIT